MVAEGWYLHTRRYSRFSVSMSSLILFSSYGSPIYIATQNASTKLQPTTRPTSTQRRRDDDELPDASGNSADVE